MRLSIRFALPVIICTLVTAVAPPSISSPQTKVVQQSRNAISGSTSPLASDCAWPIESTPVKANVAYPDSNATYWTTPYFAQPGMSITLKGTFPAARFFSINAYNSMGQDFSLNGVGSSITDYEITPDAGTQNPWITAGAAAGTYTVTLSNTSPARAINTIPLNPVPFSKPLIKGMPSATGFVIMRVYLPANNAPNSIALPKVTITTKNGAQVRTLKQCSSAQSSPTMKSKIAKKAIANMLSQVLAGKAGSAPAPSGSCAASLVFCKAGGGTTPFPNSDSGYVAAKYQPAAGYVTVVRAKMPTSAVDYGNGSGVWPSSDTDLRYWSFCNYVYVKPYPVVKIGPLMGCKADQDLPVINGTATVVISSVKDRPAITRGKNAKLGWLPTSRTNTTAKEVIAIRNMLAAPTFNQSVMNAQNSDPTSAETIMGPYYPEGTQCTTATFAKSGVAGCFRNPASPK